jgi:hypothetical protein
VSDPRIKIKRSSVSGRIPTGEQLPLGEIALNTYDGKFFASKNVGIGTTVFAVNTWSAGVGTNSYNTFFTEGNVGVNTTSPTSTLYVDGTLNVTGLSTFQSNVNISGTNQLIFGNSNNASLYNDGTDTRFINSGKLFLRSDLGQYVRIEDGSSNTLADFNSQGSVDLYYNNSKKFETISTGATVTGDFYATTYYGDGTNLTLTNSVALGGDTTGDYVASISGTANQIAVDVTSGEGTTPVISIPNNPTLPGTTVTIENDLQVNRDLNVNGNITIGGTSATLFTETLKISDPDIIVGFRTDASGNDISNDTQMILLQVMVVLRLHQRKERHLLLL